MRSVLQATDPVVISFAEALLREAGIPLHVADVNMSIVEGSIGIFPRRILVPGEDWERARRILVDADLKAWLPDAGASEAGPNA